MLLTANILHIHVFFNSPLYIISGDFVSTDPPQFPAPPAMQNARIVTSKTDSDIFFFSEWSHPDASQVLFYNTILKVNNVTLHNTTVSQNHSFCDFLLDAGTLPNYTFTIITIGLCGGISELQLKGYFNGKKLASHL